MLVSFMAQFFGFIFIIVIFFSEPRNDVFFLRKHCVCRTINRINGEKIAQISIVKYVNWHFCSKTEFVTQIILTESIIHINEVRSTMPSRKNKIYTIENTMKLLRLKMRSNIAKAWIVLFFVCHTPTYTHCACCSAICYIGIENMKWRNKKTYLNIACAIFFRTWSLIMKFY